MSLMSKISTRIVSSNGENAERETWPLAINPAISRQLVCHALIKSSRKICLLSLAPNEDLLKCIRDAPAARETKDNNIRCLIKSVGVKVSARRNGMASLPEELLVEPVTSVRYTLPSILVDSTYLLRAGFATMDQSSLRSMP
jgi:hypothetical protein